MNKTKRFIRKQSFNKLSTLIFCMGLMTTNALAHLPYILPFQFHTDKDIVTLYAGSSERYFEPEIAGGGVEGGYDFTVTNPKGESNTAIHNGGHITRHKQLTLIEIDTPYEGTYKVERILLSRNFPQALHKGEALDVQSIDELTPKEKRELESKKIVDGKRKFFLEDELNKEDITNVRYINHITTYVTKGKPNQSALKPNNKGFEFDFKTHPNLINVKSGLKFITLIDGKAESNVEFEVFKQGMDKPLKEAKSTNNGVIHISFEQPGIYVLKAQAPLDSIRDGKIIEQRYINWLVIEVKP
jgi:hypothetical protein